MNIGVFFQREPSGGGIYQYFLSVLEALNLLPKDDTLTVFHRYELDDLVYSQPRITFIKLAKPPAATSRHEVDFNGKKVLFRTPSCTRELLDEVKRFKIDLLVFPNPERESFDSGLPYIMAVHDVAHRILPEFPEFVANGISEQREYILTNGIAHAEYVLSDSNTGKELLHKFYGKDLNQIIALPFVPELPCLSHYTNETLTALKEKHHLPEQFIFYPAQFWPHKNHQLIVSALGLRKQQGKPELRAVFVGSKQEDWGEFDKVMNLARKLQVEDQIHYLGYVESQDLPGLYLLAKALVMPTFLGPTNIPIVEAFSLGCPVITSDMPGSREQTAGAALLIDPKDPASLAGALASLEQDEALSKSLIEKGKAVAKNWSSEHFRERLLSTIEQLRTS